MAKKDKKVKRKISNGKIFINGGRTPPPKEKKSNK